MSENSKYVTLRDIASACGCTTATVSLALRDHPRLSDATKQKVREMAQTLGYRRHPMLSALMANLHQSRQMTSAMPLAAVYTHSAEQIAANTFHSEVWAGMEKRARQLGFKLDRFFIGPGKMTAKRLVGVLGARGISGMVVPPLLKSGWRLKLEWNEFSAIAIGYSMLHPNLHRICPDQYSSIRIALREVRHLGYQRPGLALNLKSDQRAMHLWSSGFYGHEIARKPASFIPVFECNEFSPAELLAWYRKHKPDVIIGSDPTILKPMQKAGLKYPGDVGLVLLAGTGDQPDLAGIDQNASSIGAAAVERLVELMYYNERGVPATARVTLIPSLWHEGSSVVKQTGR